MHMCACVCRPSPAGPSLCLCASRSVRRVDVQSDTNRVVPRYIYESHITQINALCIAGTTLVSGSSDETIK